MIRYITFSSNFIEMKKEGCLRPSGMSFDTEYKNYIIFEKDWKGDAFFKAMFIVIKSMPNIILHPGDLMALIFDEHDLLIKGYQFYETPDSNENIDLDSMLNKKEISEEEYAEIGKFIYSKDEIPLAYLTNIDIPDEKRLKKIGLL